LKYFGATVVRSKLPVVAQFNSSATSRSTAALIQGNKMPRAKENSGTRRDSDAGHFLIKESSTTVPDYRKHPKRS
jgi:hypothetical protein